MALFRLSFVTKYVCDPLVSGFTCASACHVVAAEMSKAIGVHVPMRSEYGMFFYVRFLFKNLQGVGEYSDYVV